VGEGEESTRARGNDRERPRVRDAVYSVISILLYSFERRIRAYATFCQRQKCPYMCPYMCPDMRPATEGIRHRVQRQQLCLSHSYYRMCSLTIECVLLL